LKAGNYTGTLTVSGHGSTSVLSISYTVTPPATISVSPGALGFSEVAVDSRGAPTGPSCNATIWNDELAGSVGGTTPTAAADATSRRTLTIGNSGPAGSVLHWIAYFYSDTGSWLSQDLDPPGAKVEETATGPVVSTSGTQAAGTKGQLLLASIANANFLGGYPDMNQGTYRGEVVVYDLADPHTAVTVPATLVLGDGSKTPTLVAAPASLAVSASADFMTTTALTLSDGSKGCGFAYSTSSSVPWATVDPDLYSGTVGTGAATSTIPITVDTSGLSAGTYRGVVTVQSQNAEPNPFTVPITLKVTP
jgi:hypothetical protein